jgi:hypothetical protein
MLDYLKLLKPLNLCHQVSKFKLSEKKSLTQSVITLLEVNVSIVSELRTQTNRNLLQPITSLLNHKPPSSAIMDPVGNALIVLLLILKTKILC